MEQWNHLSWWNDRAVLFRSGRAGLAIQVEVARPKIPKRGAPGKTRPLGIPSVYDRVCQQALVNRLEPIFEKIFDPSSFGYRKGRKSADVAACNFVLFLFLLRPTPLSLGATMPDIETIRTEIERMRMQVSRQRSEIRQLQRAGIPTASAEALLDRMLNNIDGLCAERDRLKKEQPGPSKGRVLGGRRW